MNILLSEHAVRRAAQRNLSEEDIRFIVHYGKPVRNAGAVFYQMRANRMPPDLSPHDPRQRLIGSTVVLCSCHQYVITVYRDESAFRRDRCKTKYLWKRRLFCCPYCGERVT